MVGTVSNEGVRERPWIPFCNDGAKCFAEPLIVDQSIQVAQLEDRLAEANAAIQRVREAVEHQRSICQPGGFLTDNTIIAILDTLTAVEAALDGSYG